MLWERGGSCCPRRSAGQRIDGGEERCIGEKIIWQSRGASELFPLEEVYREECPAGESELSYGVKSRREKMRLTDG